MNDLNKSLSAWKKKKPELIHNLEWLKSKDKNKIETLVLFITNNLFWIPSEIRKVIFDFIWSINPCVFCDNICKIRSTISPYCCWCSHLTRNLKQEIYVDGLGSMKSNKYFTGYCPECKFNHERLCRKVTIKDK